MSNLRNANHLNDRVNDCLNQVNFCLIAGLIPLIMSKAARSNNAERRLGPQRIRHVLRSLCKIYEASLINDKAIFRGKADIFDRMPAIELAPITVSIGGLSW